MKHTLQTAATLVIALALLLLQGGFAVVASAPEPTQKAGCCGDACPTHCCVEENQALPTEPLPAVPASSASQQPHAALPPVLVAGPFLAAPAPSPSIRPADFSSVVSAVPLYVRTHSFLI